MSHPEPPKPALIDVEYDQTKRIARLSLRGATQSSLWDRIRARAFDDPDGRQVADDQVELSWATTLDILREFGTKSQQHAFGVRFRLEGEARQLANQFLTELRLARQARNTLTITLTEQELQNRLRTAGFTRRELRPFQIRDLVRLASLPHGANFSVPGAGKTTVTLALNLVTSEPDQHLLVISPKSAFAAWQSVIDECMDPSVPGARTEPFTLLDGSTEENDDKLRSGAKRFLMSYDLMVRQQALLASYLARQPTHLVLDEAHRMKAGADSQRGAFLLSIAPLPARRDILTGTPMPQGPGDLAAELGFLWPGQDLGLRLQRGETPRVVLGELYVRTTKTELGLPKPTREFFDIPMLPGQQALYGMARNETLRRLASNLGGGPESVDFLGARRSVMRLLQLSANPVLALKSMADDFAGLGSGVIEAVLEEGPSSKMRRVVEDARELSSQGRKVVIWTIFTGTIQELEALLADLNPVSLYGEIPTGASTDPWTREGRLLRFHSDPTCMVLIGNPAAAGEGISLHTVCHDALYVDRSYVSTHYLQSLDRIHRLGLPPGTETRVRIYRTKAPAELGSIDYSVSRRLAQKIRALQGLLDDPDLNEVALDEENADDPIDYSVELQDLIDLVEELEGKAPPSTELD